MDYNSFLPMLKRVAVKAGEEILEVYYNEELKVLQKEDNSPVTQADLRAHNVIVEELRQTEIPILSEEGQVIPYNNRKNWTHLWIVDPLDGTKEFIKRNDEFTVNIALIKEGKPILGVVYVPVSRVLYYGGPNIGAYKKENGQSPIPLKLNPNASGPTRIAVSRSHINKKTKAYIAKYPNAISIPVGSSLKFMLLAENKIDIYPRFSPCMEWDSAAAHAVLRGLDIEVISLEDQQPLHYNKKNLYNPYFIVKHNE